MAETINWTACDVKLGDLKPWDRNPKSISKNHARRLIEYWQRIGQFQTIAIGPGGEVYDGHQRLSCLLSVYGASYVVKCLRSSRPLTDEERQELVIAAHVGTTGQFDWDALSGWDASQLQEWGMDAETLQSWNTDATALREMLEAAKEEPPEDPGAQIDKAEELREKWGVETGQLWQLGEHRLICGDCTDKAVVERVMGGSVATMCFTSPPYADQRDYKNDGNLSIEYLSQFIDTTFADLWVVNLGISRKDGEINRYWDIYISKAESIGLKLLSWNVWNREGMGGSIGNMTAMFPIEHEWIFVFGKNVKEINRTRKNKHGGEIGNSTIRQKSGETTPNDWSIQSLGKIGTVFTCDYDRGEKDHPATFPVEFPTAYIEACSGLEDIIYEPFLGSGTTLIACERLGRKCRAVEISPAYVAVAIQRWVDMTGGEPELIQ